jgi:hypothetical protein
MRWRWWRSQCKVALNGSWVAVLTTNTYSSIDVSPGKLRFCSAGDFFRDEVAQTWRSLLFLHAKAGETHYLECHPGGDDAGALDPTLSELTESEGRKAIAQSRQVRFEPKRKEKP